MTNLYLLFFISSKKFGRDSKKNLKNPNKIANSNPVPAIKRRIAMPIFNIKKMIPRIVINYALVKLIISTYNNRSIPQ